MGVTETTKQNETDQSQARGMVAIDRSLLDRVRETAHKHGFRIQALVEQGIKLRLAQLEESK